MILSLAQFASIVVQQQRKMSKLWRGPAKGAETKSNDKRIHSRKKKNRERLSFLPVKLQMLWHWIPPFNAAHHMRDVHQVIVNHIGKMIRWITVGFDYNRIPFRAYGQFNITADEVLECELIRFDLKSSKRTYIEWIHISFINRMTRSSFTITMHT